MMAADAVLRKGDMPDHRQKQLAKKKRKRANVSRAGATMAQDDGRRQLLKQLPSMPLGPCFITRGWSDPEEPRLQCIVATRKLADDLVVPAAILVDLGSMGLRDAYLMKPTTVGDGLAELLALMSQMFPRGFQPIPSSVAAALVHKAITYAAALDVHPSLELVAILAILDENRDATLDVEMGRRGKPLYSPLPGEDTRPIVQKLVGAVGPDGFEVDLPSK
jgi:hypothetical protein